MKLQISRLHMAQVLGVEESTIDLGPVTEISGENASGKSSHMAAIRSVLGIDRTSLARLVHPSLRPRYRHAPARSVMRVRPRAEQRFARITPTAGVDPMTRLEAEKRLRALAYGLEPAAGGVERLLERLTVEPEQSAIVALLVERGAEACARLESRLTEVVTTGIAYAVAMGPSCCDPDCAGGEDCDHEDGDVARAFDAALQAAEKALQDKHATIVRFKLELDQSVVRLAQEMRQARSIVGRLLMLIAGTSAEDEGPALEAIEWLRGAEGKP